MIYPAISFIIISFRSLFPEIFRNQINFFISYEPWALDTLFVFVKICSNDNIIT